MTAAAALRRTPLYDLQRAAGARFVAFGDWELPLRYTSIRAEHVAVRTRAGLFDVSHMGEIEVRGSRALAVVQDLTVNDAGRLRDGQAQYSLLCRPDGGTIDDLVVHRIDAGRVLLCVNAANTAKDLAWIRAHAAGAEVVDRSAETAQLALQGPRATAILRPLTDVPLDALPPFGFAEGHVAGRRALVARTGYTGEDGWEIYCGAGDAAAVWTALQEAGAPHGLALAGLGARDTLRLERALPLYGHELSEDVTPLEAGLARFVCFDKPAFVGRAALLARQAAGPARHLVGLEMREAGIPRAGYAILADGRPAGVVTSGTLSPTLGKAIALGYVAHGLHDAGTRLAVRIRERAARCEVVTLPFYRRGGARRR